jgi:hypothetical protein
MLNPTPPRQTRLATPSQNNLTRTKSNHQHHAANASVIYLRIMSIAIFTLLKIKTKHNLHKFKNHENIASGIPYKT